MQVQFEENEMLIINGFLCVAKQGAIQDKNRSMVKFANRLIKKFVPNAKIVNLKAEEMDTVAKILEEALIDNEKNSTPEIPRLAEGDKQACENALAKLEEKLG